MLSKERLLAEAARTGFRPEILEKVLRLLGLLEQLSSHSYLKGRIALKGGTALNLFCLDTPRLSVDIDLNYIGSPSRGVMLSERPQVELALEAVCRQENLAIKRVPSDHAGGKWRLTYASVLGQGGNLAVDLNFILRSPLWPVTTKFSCVLGRVSRISFPVLDLHELVAGKLAALLTRSVARDLFDAYQLFMAGSFDWERLRLGFLVYGAMNRRDWRTIDPESLAYDTDDLRKYLIPVLKTDYVAEIGDIEVLARHMIEQCRKGLQRLLPFSDKEREFLDRLLDYGEICPRLITLEDDMIALIANHPGILWKALNVKNHKDTLLELIE